MTTCSGGVQSMFSLQRFLLKYQKKNVGFERDLNPKPFSLDCLVFGVSQGGNFCISRILVPLN